MDGFGEARALARPNRHGRRRPTIHGFRCCTNE
jgi:hypothetical protein